MAVRLWTAMLRVVGSVMAALKVTDNDVALDVHMRGGCDPALRARGGRGLRRVADRASEVSIVLKARMRRGC